MHECAWDNVNEERLGRSKEIFNMLFSLGLLSAPFLIYKTPKMKVFGFEDCFVVKSAFFLENQYIATTETKAKCKILKKKL